MAITIKSKVFHQEVFTSLSDVIKTLYKDLDVVETESEKKYIRFAIKQWEEYEEDILKQADQDY